jgi:hypothetical protein
LCVSAASFVHSRELFPSFLPSPALPFIPAARAQRALAALRLASRSLACTTTTSSSSLGLCFQPIVLVVLVGG